MKKIGFLFLSLFIIFGFGVSLANPIAPETYFICSMFENVAIDNYRIIVQNGSEFYEPIIGACSQCGQRPVRRNYDNNKLGIRYYPDFSYIGPTQKVFLLDKSIAVEDVTEDNVEIRAISIGSITSTYCDRGANKTRVYKIVKDGNIYTMLDKTENYKIRQELKNKVKKFPLFWSIAVLIETLTLFFIAKFFWKENEISNKKLLLFGIVPTTITLPLLRFLLPLVLGNGIRYTIIGEILVTILEAIMLKYGLNVSWKKSIIVSIICNVFSFAILGWGSLIMDFYDNQRIIFSFSIPIWVKIYLPVLYFLTEFVVLCISGKMGWNGEQISNKKLILTGIIAPVVMILPLALLMWILVILHLDNQNRLQFVNLLVSLFIEMLLIKYLLKVSWKKSIIMVILSILCFIVISFFVRILFGLYN